MKSGNSNLVPEARDALNGFKMEAARKVGVHSALKKHTKKPQTARTAAHPGRLFFGLSEGSGTVRQRRTIMKDSEIIVKLFLRNDQCFCHDFHPPAFDFTHILPQKY